MLLRWLAVARDHADECVVKLVRTASARGVWPDPLLEVVHPRHRELVVEVVPGLGTEAVRQTVVAVLRGNRGLSEASSQGHVGHKGCIKGA